MKANELMPGDWVKNDLGEIQQVVELHEDKVMLSYNDFYDYDDIEPVPLTEDILIRNGFYKEPFRNHDEYSLDGFPFVIAHNPISGEWYGGTYIVTIVEDYVEKQFECGYVHKIQHALSLCETKKEIII